MIAMEFEYLTFCKCLHLSSSVSSFVYVLQFSWVSFIFLLAMLVSDYLAEQNWCSKNTGISQYMAPRNEFFNNLIQK